MFRINKESFACVAPSAVWILLMTMLPTTTVAYLVRSVAAAAVLLYTLKVFPFKLPSFSAVAWGVFSGLVVLALWVLPEKFECYTEHLTYGNANGDSPFDPKNCGWMMTMVRLIGSSFIIAPIEEIFFRFYLYRRLISTEWKEVNLSRFDLSAFVWVVGLFAIEHNRPLAGAMAGAIYLVIAIKKGIGAAIVSHITTNFGLSLYVIKTGLYGFW